MDVRVLGRLVITDPDGRLVTAEDLPRRARQVLGVLAARHDRVQSKDALADAVWGDELPGNHAAALEHYVSVLRRSLQPGVPTAEAFIVTRAGGYVLTTERVHLDLAQLRAAAREAEREPGRLDVRERIVELAGGLPFAEDEYADWAAPARTEVRQALVAALLELAESAVAGDPAVALRLARQSTELEPYTERGHRLTMRAAAALGQAEEVVRAFDRCQTAMSGDLGLPPSTQLTALRDRLLAELRTAPPGRTGPGSERRRGDRRAADRPEQAPQTRRLTLVPEPLAEVVELRPAAGPAGFAGRQVELEVLTGDTPVVHVTGPAGAGKSALLDELRNRHPGTAGVGRGPGPGGALRLGWLRTVLQQLSDDTAGEDALLDAAMTARRSLAPAELDVIAARLRGRIVAIDDAEHLDADSVGELRWLREHGTRIVVSYRYPSAVADRPLHALPADLVLRLEPLDETELPAETLAASGGIPALVQVSPELSGAVAMHLARQRTRWMPPAAWEVLRLTAALGTLRVDQLASVGGLDLDEVLGAVDRLVHAHLLVEGPGGHVRHRSDLVRQAVAAQMSAAHGQHLRTRMRQATA